MKDREQFERLAFKNQYMFGRIMQDKEICKELIERILGITVTSIEYLNAKQVLEPTLYGKGSELDLFVRAEEGVFDIEIQASPRKGLEERFSYYQANLMTSELMKGAGYDDIPRITIVFICDYDPFGYGLPVYEIKPTCKQLSYGDIDFRQTWVALNCKAWKDADSAPLRNLLQYVADGEVNKEDTLISSIDAAVTKANDDEKWVSDVYSVSHTLEDLEREKGIAVRAARREGMAEGEARGHQKGLAEGEARGRREGMAEGEAKGIAEGEHRLGTLISKLISEGRMSDIEKASTDQAYRNTLFAEYGI